MTEHAVILQAKDISKSFLGVKALNNVQLEVYRGEVHALIGENGAGKSTLMNIIFGILPRDSGTILLDGQEVNFHSPSEAIRSGIAMIHQETRLVPTLSVAENIWMGREDSFCTLGLMSHSRRGDATAALLAEWDIAIDPHELVANLSVAQMQLVELARAISTNAKVIIMDEPTSALAEKEVAVLFSIIRRLTQQGTSIIYISHKMEELFRICDRVTVFRDGCYISTDDCAAITSDRLIEKIVGRELDEMFPKLEAKIGKEVLRVENLTRYGAFSDISFSVREGEILGISGLAGAGRTEIVQAIFGVDRPDSGAIYLDARPVTIRQPYDAVRLGIAMVTEDRLRLGALAQLSVRANMTLAALGNYCHGIFTNRAKEQSACDEMIRDLAVKLSDREQPMDSLSGGNQQKVILGRWLLTHPRVLILDEPTRGIDVGAKSEIHRLISLLAQQGMAIILISSEMPEILGMSDRILIIREGKQVFECGREEASQELLGKYALGD